MRDCIKQRLDSIYELYPADRLIKSKERWRRLWGGEKPLDRLPFVAGPINIGYDAVDSAENRLVSALDEIICRGRFADDYIPAIFPGCRQSTIPSMFGSKEIIVGEDCTCTRVIEDAADIDSLLPAQIIKGSVASNWIVMQRYFLSETDGQIPIHVTDMQGPVDVAGQLWGYDNLLSAAYLDPDRYHRLMGMTTDAFILLWQAQMDAIGAENFVGTHLFGWDWVPQGNGATISVDSMVMVSSPFFREYYAPYISQIGERFGGFTVHSCGDFSSVIPEINFMNHIKGVNASQMSISQLYEAGLSKELVLITGSSMDNVSDIFDIIKREGLRVDLTVSPWPGGEKGGKPHLWEREDWDLVKANEQKILSFAQL